MPASRKNQPTQVMVASSFPFCLDETTEARRSARARGDRRRPGVIDVAENDDSSPAGWGNIAVAADSCTAWVVPLTGGRRPPPGQSTLRRQQNPISWGEAWVLLERQGPWRSPAPRGDR